MHNYVLLILLLIVIVIIFNNNGTEPFGFGLENPSNEAIQSVSSIFNDEHVILSNVSVTGTMASTDIKSTGNLNIEGDTTIKGNVTPAGDFSVEGNTVTKGNTTINGDVTVDGNLNLGKTKARYINVGNADSPIWNKDWTLIELQALNLVGKDVALKKPVRQLKGAPGHGTKASNITSGGIFHSHDNFNDNWRMGYHGVNTQHKLQIDLGKTEYIDKIV